MTAIGLWGIAEASPDHQAVVDPDGGVVILWSLPLVSRNFFSISYVCSGQMIFRGGGSGATSSGCR
ncbi:hypothetical protein ACFQ1S_46360, partial [Kibdelosporangium lantanae]